MSLLLRRLILVCMCVYVSCDTSILYYFFGCVTRLCETLTHIFESISIKFICRVSQSSSQTILCCFEFAVLCVYQQSCLACLLSDQPDHVIFFRFSWSCFIVFVAVIFAACSEVAVMYAVCKRLCCCCWGCSARIRSWYVVTICSVSVFIF